MLGSGRTCRCCCCCRYLIPEADDIKEERGGSWICWQDSVMLCEYKCVCVKEKWKKRMIIKRWTKRSCPYIQELTRIIIGVTYEEQHIWDAPHSAAFLLQERDPLVPLYRDWADSSTHTHTFHLLISLLVGERGWIIIFSLFHSPTHWYFGFALYRKRFAHPCPYFPFPNQDM